MPLFTVLNPTEEQVGPYPPFSRKTGVNLNNNQAGQLVGLGLAVLPDGAEPRDVARAAFALLGAIFPGISSSSQRQQTTSKAGLQEWQDLLLLLKSID